MKSTLPTLSPGSLVSGIIAVALLNTVGILSPHSALAQRLVNRPAITQQNLIQTEFNNRTEWRLVITPYKQGNPDKQNSVPIKPGERVTVSSTEGTRYGIFRGNDRIDHYVVEKRNKPYVILPPQSGGRPPAPPAPTQPTVTTNTPPPAPATPSMPPAPPTGQPTGQPTMPPAPGNGGQAEAVPGVPEYLGLLINDLTAPLDAYYHISDAVGNTNEILIATIAPSEQGTPIDLVQPGIFITFRERGESVELEPLFFYEVGQENNQVILLSDLVMAFMSEEGAAPSGPTGVEVDGAGVGIIRTPAIGDTEYAKWVEKDQITRRTKELATMSFLEGYTGSLKQIMPSYSGYNVKKMDTVFLSRDRGTDNNSLLFEPPIGSSYSWHTAGSQYRIPLYLDYLDVGGGFSESQAQKSIFFSSEERSKTFELNATSPNGYTAGYSRSESEMEKSSSVAMVSTHWASSYWLTLDKRFLELQPQFIEAVKRLGNSYDEHVKFFEKYGTHYPVSTLYGGLKYTQQYVKAEEAASRLQKGWKAGFERKGQFQAGPATAEVTTALSVGETTTNESAAGSSVDTEGSIAYGTLASGSEPSTEPIKVHLEAIHELVLPTLFGTTTQAEADLIIQKKVAMQIFLATYLTPRGGTVESRTPRVFEMKVTNITLIEEDDDYGDPAPELYEHIYILGKNSSKEVSSANVWYKDISDRVTVEKNQSLKLNEHVARTVIFPKAVNKGGDNWGADYELEKHYFHIHVNLKEDDTLVPKKNAQSLAGGKVVKLTELAANGVLTGSPLAGSFDLKGNGGTGTIRVRYQLMEVPFGKVQNPPLNLPDFPRYSR